VNLKDIFIAGVPGRRANARAIYENLEVRPNGKFNIFVFHHTVSEADNITSDIPISLLPKGFDYYAAGHWHKKCEFPYSKGIVVYPGSTEFNTVDEMDDNDRGFFIVDTISGGKEFRKCNTRDAITKDVEIKDLTIDDVNQKCIDMIPKKGDGEILILKLKGSLKNGVKSMIDKERINSLARERGFLIARTRTTHLVNPEVKIHVDTKKKSLEDIEREFLGKLGYEKSVVELAIEMTKILGKDIIPSKKGEVIAHVISMIEEVMGK
jgi:DNA repair exonuclease SbcCD nuclease subunit